MFPTQRECYELQQIIPSLAVAPTGPDPHELLGGGGGKSGREKAGK